MQAQAKSFSTRSRNPPPFSDQCIFPEIQQDNCNVCLKKSSPHGVISSRRWGGGKLYQSHTLGFDLGYHQIIRKKDPKTLPMGFEGVFFLLLSHAVPWGIKEMGDIHHPALLPCDRISMSRKAVAHCHVGKGKGLHQLCAC